MDYANAERHLCNTNKSARGRATSDWNKSNAICSNDVGPPGYLNADIEPGGWRTLQFDHPPFSESATIILQWTVHARAAWWRKATYLFYGAAKDSGPSRDDLPDLRCRKPRS